MKKLGLIEPDAKLNPRELAPPHRKAGISYPQRHGTDGELQHQWRVLPGAW